MSTTILVFPSAAGGNHLKNLVALHKNYANIDPNVDYKNIYMSKSIPVHANQGNGLTHHAVEQALANPDKDYFMWGHFVATLTLEDRIKLLKDLKFILLAPVDNRGQELLNKRFEQVYHRPFLYADYANISAKQILVYKPFMYHGLFQVEYSNILTIPIEQWFSIDITNVIQQINSFLNIEIDFTVANNLHSQWLSKFTIDN
jgi:hypothetical protein